MNRILAYLFSLAIFLLVFILALEGGLFLLGKSPQPTINEFHPKLGWVKTAHSEATRKTSEFDVTYRINGLGLREDESLAMDKPAGTTRILFLGDSFTLGYTVDRADLFVDILEQILRDEGRKIEIINAGTEGYSTDQELVWLKEEGLKYSPDIVIMNFYQNDVYWNSQDHYGRFPKPLFNESGMVNTDLENPGELGWLERNTAVGKLFLGAANPAPPTFETANGKHLPSEWGVILRKAPDFIEQSWVRTESILKDFKATCEARQIKPLVALIPTKAQIYQSFKDEQGRQLRLEDKDWNPNLPFHRMQSICQEINLDSVDPKPLFEDLAANQDAQLYYTVDRHFSPQGNRAFAQALYYHLVSDAYLGKSGKAEPDFAASSGANGSLTSEAGLPTWLFVVLGLWLVLGIFYAVNNRDENGFLGFLKVGMLIGLVVGIVSLLNWLADLCPGESGRWIFGGVVVAIIFFLAWKIRKRFGIIAELYITFTQRGHWYMMPLLAVMLAIGSLLIVAASSPFVAPFIYTLF